MLHALEKELELRHHELESKTISSLYFGGGTPSLLSADELKRLMDEVAKYFSFAPDIEITLEANPDDLHRGFVRELAGTPINRLSIGIQSFFDDDLKLMNRAHNAVEAESSIKSAQDFGLENISIDLIYGAPTSTSELWKQNLSTTAALGVPHISAYALTIEPKTALSSWVASGKIAAPSEAVQHDDFLYMVDFLKEQGFDHYEISNFGKPGFHSRHNTAYWKSTEYLGLGPSAHSYDGARRRSWNIANNRRYIEYLNQNIPPTESEILSARDQLNEMLMIGLRTEIGVDLARLSAVFNDEIFSKLQSDWQQKLIDGKLIIQNNYLKIPENHWFLADGIASDLFQLN